MQENIWTFIIMSIYIVTNPKLTYSSSHLAGVKIYIQIYKSHKITQQKKNFWFQLLKNFLLLLLLFALPTQIKLLYAILTFCCCCYIVLYENANHCHVQHYSPSSFSISWLLLLLLLLLSLGILLHASIWNVIHNLITQRWIHKCCVDMNWMK